MRKKVILLNIIPSLVLHGLTQAGGAPSMILFSCGVYQLSFQIFIIVDISLNICIYNKEQVYFHTTDKSKVKNLVNIIVFNN